MCHINSNLDNNLDNKVIIGIWKQKSTFENQDFQNSLDVEHVFFTGTQKLCLI